MGPFRRRPPPPPWIRGDDELVAYAEYLWGTVLDPDFLVWLVPVDRHGRGGEGDVVVHDLPTLPEPVDRRAMGSFVQAAAAIVGPDDPRPAVAAVLWRPDADGDDIPERAWARVVRDAAAVEGVRVQGIVAVSARGTEVLQSTGRTGWP